MRLLRPGFIAALIGLVLPAAASAQATAPDFLASDNVELVNTFRPATGLTAGARVVGNRLFVTSSKDLEIFDITKPEAPKLISKLEANIQFENEEVPTNGKLLGISSDLLNSGPECLSTPAGVNVVVGGGCLRLYDVRDPAGIKELPSVVGAGDHTSTCILDCTYFYGSRGSITDARTALDPGGRAVKLKEKWTDAVQAQAGKFTSSCHNVNELRPGIIITACNPSAVLSVLPEDGGSITVPKVLFTGTTPQEAKRFIHSARWPRNGDDKFILLGGETNFRPNCDQPGPLSSTPVGAFMTFDASHVKQDGKYTPIDEIRPTNGSYLDSNPPAQVLGCSVHWFEEHPSFRNGGLVALAEYENGTRFLQILPDGKIKEQGYFVPLGGSTSSPDWAPNSNILYASDYERGIDVLRYKGSLYVPDEQGKVTPEPGAVPGTEGRQPGQPAAAGGASAAVCASDAGFERATVVPNNEEGLPATGLRFLVNRRQKRSFTVDVFQQSAGRRVIGERRVAHFTNRSGTFSWKGRRSLRDGFYFARFTMALPGGVKDVRRGDAAPQQGPLRQRAGVLRPRHVRRAALLQAHAAGVRPRRARHRVPVDPWGRRGLDRRPARQPCGQALHGPGDRRRPDLPRQAAGGRDRPRRRGAHPHRGRPRQRAGDVDPELAAALGVVRHSPGAAAAGRPPASRTGRRGFTARSRFADRR